MILADSNTNDEATKAINLLDNKLHVESTTLQDLIISKDKEANNGYER